MLGSERRFIVADHGLEKVVGHHYETSKLFAETAAQNGFRPVVLAYRGCELPQISEDFAFVPFFRNGLYGSQVKTQAASSRLATLTSSVARSAMFAFNKLLHTFSRLTTKSTGTASKARGSKTAKRPAGTFQRPLSRIKRLLRENYYVEDEPDLLAEDFNRCLLDYELTSQDIILVHTASAKTLCSVASALRWVPLNSCPVFHIRVLYDDDINPEGSGITLHDAFLRLKSTQLLNKRVFVHAETGTMQSRLQEIGFSDVLLIPPVVLALEPKRSKSVKRDEPVTLLYLGEARAEKGFHLLPDLVRNLLGSPSGPDWKLVVQVSTFQAVIPPEIRSAIGELVHFDDDRIKLIEGDLSTERMAELRRDADIILMPYARSAYRRRGSGIFVAALTEGKGLVVRSGTSMSFALAEGAGITFNSDSEFPRAVLASIRNARSLLDRASQEAAKWRKLCAPERFFAALPRFDRRARDASGAIPTAVVTAPLFTQQGSSHVFRWQVNYLIDRGFRVIAINLLSWAGAWDPLDILRKEGLRAATRAATQQWSVGLRYHVAIFRWRRFRGRVQTYEQRLKDNDLFCIPPSLSRVMEENRPSLFLVNYAVHIPLAKRLIKPGTPIVVESHDVEAKQELLRKGNVPLYRRSLGLEQSLLSEANAIACISAFEVQAFGTVIEPEKIHFVPPVAEPAQDPAEMLAGCQNTADVLLASGLVDRAPKSSTSLPSKGGIAAINEEIIRVGDKIDRVVQLMTEGHERRVHEDNIDLLFVGSTHFANVKSLRWFLREVFDPYLSPENVKLWLAGTVCSELKGDVGPNVISLGEVPDLRPLYAAAKVVVIPVTVGTGVPIKSIDAISAGKPSVATLMAVRGVQPLLEDFPTFDDAQVFASETLRLLRDQNYRLAAANRVHKPFEAFSTDAHFRRWDAILAGIGIEPPHKGSGPAATAKWSHFEFSDSYRRFNAILRAFLEEGKIDPADRDFLESCITSSDSSFRRCYEAFVVKQTAPILPTLTNLPDSSRFAEALFSERVELNGTHEDGDSSPAELTSTRARHAPRQAAQ